MKKAAITILALIASALAFAHNEPTVGKHMPRYKQVCASGCEFTTICGATCSSATSDCVNGSAIDAIKDAADFGVTSPYTVVVEAGNYTECVSINDVTDLTIRIAEGARIVPAVVAATDVAGGVIRIGNSTTAQVQRIKIISEGYVRNDAWSAPEGALTIGPEASTGTSKWDDVEIVGGTWIGNHDGIHVYGDKTSSHTATAVPRVTIRNLTVISGADAIVKKAASDLTIRNVYMRSMSNYCETTVADVTDLESGTVDATGATTTTFTLDADANTTTDAYNGRHGKLTLGTCAAGIDFWVTDYSGATKLVTTTALGLTPDATCTYTIDAVTNAAEAPCTEVDWTTIRANGIGSGYWKVTGLHFGINISQGNAPDLDLTKLFDSLIEIEVNDFATSSGSSACTGQQHVAGILGYDAAGDHQTFVAENVAIRIVNNAVLRSSTAQADNLCAYPLVGVSLPVTDFEGYASFSGSIRIDNPGDPGATDYGIVAAQSAANTLRVPRAHIEINNSAAGYSGTTATVLQAGSATLSLGEITSDAAITTSGSMTWLKGAASGHACAVVSDLAAADDSFEFWQTDLPVTITSVGCRCRGSCSTLATFTLEDRGGNAMTITGTNPTCATTGNATYAAVTAGNALVAGEGLAFDVTNAVSPETDEYTICVTYQTGG